MLMAGALQPQLKMVEDKLILVYQIARFSLQRALQFCQQGPLPPDNPESRKERLNQIFEAGEAAPIASQTVVHISQWIIQEYCLLPQPRLLLEPSLLAV